MLEIKLSFDTRELEQLATLGTSIRKAASTALTLTAKAAQAELKATAPSIFHLRNNWITQGIRIEPATQESLNAKVGSIDLYMGRHVLGETKQGSPLNIAERRDAQGRYATGGLFIPVYNDIASVLTHRQMKRKLDRADDTKRPTFQIIGRDGQILVVRRKSKKRAPLEILAAIKASAREEPIWPMAEIVSAVVSAKFETFFSAAAAFMTLPRRK